MVVCIIITALFFTLFILAMIDYIRTEDNNSDNVKMIIEAAKGGFMIFIVALIITVGLCANAANKKALYIDMANNPQCYSINDLKDAHESIICHKVRRGCWTWTSFYNGYEFPEINVDVMNSVDQTIHIVK